MNTYLVVCIDAATQSRLALEGCVFSQEQGYLLLRTKFSRAKLRAQGVYVEVY